MQFPFSETRTYAPPDSGLEEFRVLQQRLGLSRSVFVQASCHGTDNRAMIDAMLRGEGSYAGVAMIDDSHSDDDLDEFHAAGVRGIRFNFVKHLGGAPDLNRFWSQIERIRPRGWHVELHFDARDFPEHTDLLDRMPVPFMIDHMARVDATAGVDQAPFQRPLRGQFVDLDRFPDLQDGETYRLDFFFAERHRTQSNFRIQTNIAIRSMDMPMLTAVFD